MAYDFSEFKKVSESTLNWLKSEYTGIHTGRASPSVLDKVTVSAYGTPQPINQLATISIEDSRNLRITPWDKNVAKDIDSAIRESNLGLSVSADSDGLRVSFPELTSERRNMLSKVIKEKLEEARIAVRSEREKVLNTLDRQEKDGSLSKDDKFRSKGELQKLVDEANKNLEELSRKKEADILE